MPLTLADLKLRSYLSNAQALQRSMDSNPHYSKLKPIFEQLLNDLTVGKGDRVQELMSRLIEQFDQMIIGVRESERKQLQQYREQFAAWRFISSTAVSGLLVRSLIYMVWGDTKALALERERIATRVARMGDEFLPSQRKLATLSVDALERQYHRLTNEQQAVWLDAMWLMAAEAPKNLARQNIALHFYLKYSKEPLEALLVCKHYLALMGGSLCDQSYMPALSCCLNALCEQAKALVLSPRIVEEARVRELFAIIDELDAGLGHGIGGKVSEVLRMLGDKLEDNMDVNLWIAKTHCRLLGCDEESHPASFYFARAYELEVTVVPVFDYTDETFEKLSCLVKANNTKAIVKMKDIVIRKAPYQHRARLCLAEQIVKMKGAGELERYYAHVDWWLKGIDERQVVRRTDLRRVQLLVENARRHSTHSMEFCKYGDLAKRRKFYDEQLGYHLMNIGLGELSLSLPGDSSWFISGFKSEPAHAMMARQLANFASDKMKLPATRSLFSSVVDQLYASVDLFYSDRYRGKSILSRLRAGETVFVFSGWSGYPSGHAVSITLKKIGSDIYLAYGDRADGLVDSPIGISFYRVHDHELLDSNDFFNEYLRYPSSFTYLENMYHKTSTKTLMSDLKLERLFLYKKTKQKMGNCALVMMAQGFFAGLVFQHLENRLPEKVTKTSLTAAVEYVKPDYKAFREYSRKDSLNELYTLAKVENSRWRLGIDVMQMIAVALRRHFSSKLARTGIEPRSEAVTRRLKSHLDHLHEALTEEQTGSRAASGAKFEPRFKPSRRQSALREMPAHEVVVEPKTIKPSRRQSTQHEMPANKVVVEPKIHKPSRRQSVFSEAAKATPKVRPGPGPRVRTHINSRLWFEPPKKPDYQPRYRVGPKPTL